jgi:Sep15/SelM redox domain
LNRYPLLKSFLKDGEAEWYRNVHVTYIAGREAILTIKDKNGIELEKVVMHTLPDKAAMHAMMVSKGFVLDEDKKSEAMRKEKERREVVRKEAVKDEGRAVRQGSLFSDINHNARQKQLHQQASAAQEESPQVHHTEEDVLRMALSSSSSLIDSYYSSYSTMIFSVVIAGVIVGFMWRQNKKRRTTRTTPLTGQIRLS